LADLPLMSSPFPVPALLIIFRIDSKLTCGIQNDRIMSGTDMCMCVCVVRRRRGRGEGR
jgi:hypothetical protein